MFQLLNFDIKLDRQMLDVTKIYHFSQQHELNFEFVFFQYYQHIIQLNSGKVVAVGPGTCDRDGKLIPVIVKEGDVVLLPEYGGTEVKLGDKKYVFYFPPVNLFDYFLIFMLLLKCQNIILNPAKMRKTFHQRPMQHRYDDIII